MNAFSVHGAPSEYILQEGALNLLEEKLLERGLKKILVVHGEKSWNAAKAFWPVLSEVEFDEYTYSGECSIEEITVVSEIIKSQSYNGVVGVGGGKVLDLVKAVCDTTRVQAVLIPTLASNCSPWTPLSVLYDGSGAFIRYDVYPICTSLVLIEPNILVGAPLDLFIAGIGDTLAKWYEADVQMAGIVNKPVPLQISHYTARQCKDLIIEHSEEAIKAVQTGMLNDEFIKVAETIIVLGGMVGGFGDHYGRIAGAHSIHNGLTALEETHHALHGNKVAYGILVQLVLEGKLTEIEALLPFYHRIGLPVSLKNIGVKEISKELVTKVAEKATIKAESIHVMPIGQITPNRVEDAIFELEKNNRI
ncbi:iron-containing alcohol dehydrogenase family protein [Robertmurraya yapensis]|uniref:Iron-containing alcohol dehydrogenase family protein n=1 Tax=Bacillus yapensis TaxID=2492960 RepID=A0A3S0L4X7_9BACI|nr:iron-containing alcohol dehydrogenase family protein [Bacillus yapensis]RTR27129.1 iron-containing alcohol dehydrogenase family protein [Bacillus yapensis]TKS93976.1 iron-containing alcohol dehydrogenase [Bacillus yapensis]